MDGRQRRLDGHVLQVGLLRLQGLQSLLGRRGDDAALGRVAEPGNPSPDFGEPAIALCANNERGAYDG